MKKIIALVFMIMMFGSVCSAELLKLDPDEWGLIGGNSAHNVYYDKKSVVFGKQPYGRCGAVAVLYEEKDGTGSLLEYYEINLDTKQIRTVIITNYDADGNKINSKRVEEKFEDVVPDTPGDIMYQMLYDIGIGYDKKSGKG